MSPAAACYVVKRVIVGNEERLFMRYTAHRN
jgi:hypothetical protein